MMIQLFIILIHFIFVKSELDIYANNDTKGDIIQSQYPQQTTPKQSRLITNIISSTISTTPPSPYNDTGFTIASRFNQCIKQQTLAHRPHNIPTITR